MTNTPAEYFEYALLHNEIAAFISGRGKYFVVDREWGTHWHYGSFSQYIQPYLSNNNEVLPEQFWKSVTESIDQEADKHDFLINVLGYLITYYHSPDKEINNHRRISTPPYFIEKIQVFVIENKESLSADRREPIRHLEGLYGIIVDTLKLIEQRGGPNFKI